MVSTIVVGLGWLVSMGFYAVGLWPLGALLRVGLFIFALGAVYWIIRHLVEGEDEISRKQFEQWREKSGR